jgi:hypothetical protein
MHLMLLFSAAHVSMHPLNLVTLEIGLICDF